MVVDVCVVVEAAAWVVAVVVLTGASVVSSSAVVADSSPPHAVAINTTADRTRSALRVFTEGECIRRPEPTGSIAAGSVGTMADLVSIVATALTDRADPEKAGPMAAYLKTEMPFYGVQKKGRTEVLRLVRKEYPIEDNSTYRNAVLALWEQPHREEKYLAISIARQHKPFITLENLDIYKKLVVEGAWWDLVDDVAINLVGSVHLHQRKKMESVIERWIDDDDMWLRRTSLISPIKHKAETDHETLFDHCLRRADEKEFFIRKAIGWTLREYAKTEPERVRRFLIKHRDRWSGLSFREASKHLDIT